MATADLAFIIKEISRLREGPRSAQLSPAIDILVVAVFDIANEVIKLDERMTALEQGRKISN
jgi:hypothetical protein